MTACSGCSSSSSSSSFSSSSAWAWRSRSRSRPLRHITVGSRAAGAEAEKAVPVDVITQRADRGIRLLGNRAGDPGARAIVQLPAADASRDGTDTVRPATLRGLGPDQVLVLINGKRRHQSALVHLNGSIGRGSTGVDLNAIPVVGDRTDRGAARRRGGAVRIGRHRRRHQHRAEGRRRAARRIDEVRPLDRLLHRQSLRPNGLNCVEGDDIDFSDGGLFDIGGSGGFAVARRQRDDCGGISPSQSHEPRVVRSARSDRRGRCGQQRGVRCPITAGAIPIRAT